MKGKAIENCLFSSVKQPNKFNCSKSFLAVSSTNFI